MTFTKGGCVSAKVPLAERFWAKVDFDGPIMPGMDTECHVWTGATSNGYGKITRGGRGEGHVPAHRLSLELQNGEPVPTNKKVDHICHNPPCVNAQHLRIATDKENVENMAGASRNSKSGVLGVWWDKSRQRWTAQVCHNYRKIHLGYFETIAEAQASAVAKRNELFTHNDADRRVSGAA